MRRLDRLRGRALARSILLTTMIGLQAERERLAQHHAGLGHRALGGVDEEQAPVRHAEDALDLAAEVGVPGRVDDVELDPVVPDRGRLREDRDSLLALEVVGVHDQLADLLVRREDVRLLQQRVDQGGLAVVDVGDDRDVAEVGSARCAAAWTDVTSRF